jgi:hypothetical protein
MSSPEDIDSIPYLTPMVLAGFGLGLGLMMVIVYKDFEFGLASAGVGLAVGAITGTKEFIWRKIWGTRRRKQSRPKRNASSKSRDTA